MILNNLNLDKLIIEEASENDLDSIAEFYSQYNHEIQNPECLRWKYFSNPAGKGLLLVLKDGKRNILATLGYIPRIIQTFAKTNIEVIEAVDLFIAPEARGQKLYPRLQSYGMSIAQKPIIGFPNKRSEKIILDSGWKTMAPLENWVFPISPECIGITQKQTTLYQAAYSCFKIYKRIWVRNSQAGLSLEKISHFDSSILSDDHSKWNEKKIQLLNWRFAANPSKKFLIFSFYEGENAIGYCVLHYENRDIVIYDFAARKKRMACLGKIIEYGVTERLSKIIFPGAGLKLWRYGFFKMPSKVHLIAFNLNERLGEITFKDCDW